MRKSRTIKPLPEAVPTDLLSLVPSCRPKDNAEVRERCRKYFEYCNQTESVPGIEGLALCIGVSRESLWRWEHGIDCDQERAELIRTAKRSIYASLEKSALSGHINPVTFIFLSKVWMHYNDDAGKNEQDAVTVTGIEQIERIGQRLPGLKDHDKKNNVDELFSDVLSDIK